MGQYFAEIDLDTTKYTRSQKRILSEAKSTATNVEKNWSIIGQKSDLMYDAMRQRITNAYEMIKNKATSTAQEIVRAERAAKEQLRKIDEKQYGRQVTMLDKIKSNWLAVATAIYSIHRAFGNLETAIKAASDLEEVTSKFNVVFKGQVQLVETWADTLVDSYAMSTREAKQYLSSVQDLLKPMGMQADLAAEMSFEIVKLSADLGSFNNLPTAQVMADIQSALVGNYETMKKYGVVLNATVVQERALAMGLAESKDKLTAADKAQAAYALTVAGSADAIGDMARTMDDFANQTKQLKANIENLEAAIGGPLKDAINEVVKATNDWVKENDKVIQKLPEYTTRALFAAGATWELIKAQVGFKPWGKAIEEITEKYKKLQEQIDEIANGPFFRGKIIRDATEDTKGLISESERLAIIWELLPKYSAKFVNDIRGDATDALIDFVDEMHKRLMGELPKLQAEWAKMYEKNDQKALENYDDTLDEMRDSHSDFLQHIMNDQIDSWADLFDSILNYFKRLLFNMRNEADSAQYGIWGSAFGGNLTFNAPFSTALGYAGVSGGIADQLDLFGGSQANIIGAGIGGALGGIGIETALFAMWGPLGAAVGAILGGLIGDLFEGDPNTFTIDEIIKDQMGWTPGIGVNAADLFGASPHDPSHWVQPIHDAVIQGTTQIIDVFNQGVIDALNQVPPDMAASIKERLKTYEFDFSDLFVGRWEVGSAEDVVTRILEAIGERFNNIYNNLFSTAAIDYLTDVITGSEFFGALSTSAQDIIKTRISSGDIEDIINLVSAFEQGATVFEDIMFAAQAAAGVLTDLEIQTYQTNKQFDGWIETLRALGVSEEEIKKIEDLRTITLNNLATATEDATDGLMKMVEVVNGVGLALGHETGLTASFKDIQFQILSTYGGMSDLEIQTYRVNKQFDGWIKTLLDLGATTEQLMWVEDQRAMALAQLTDATVSSVIDIDRVRSQYLQLLTGPSNPADIFERLKIMEAQLAPIGSALTEADLAMYVEYLTLAQQAYQRPSLEYQEIYKLVLSAYEAVLQTADPGFVGVGDTYDQNFNFHVEIHVDGSKSPTDTAQEVRQEFVRVFQGSGRKMIQDAARSYTQEWN